jgi:hypothetical protein
LEYNKLTLKNKNFSNNENKKILKFITKIYRKTSSNNPIALNKNDLKIVINKILEN